MGNAILEALEFDEEKGAIFFKGVRYLLLRPETLAEFQKGLEERLGEEAQEILYRGGFTGATCPPRITRRHMDTVTMKSPSL